MSTVDELIQQAITQAKAGNKLEAKKILSQVVKQEPQNAHAWYLLSHVVDEQEQAEYCLEKVVAIQPENARAKNRLAQIKAPLEDIPGKATISSNAPVILSNPKKEVTQDRKPRTLGRNQMLTILGLGFLVLILVVVAGVLFLSSLWTNAPESSEASNEEIILPSPTQTLSCQYEVAPYVEKVGPLVVKFSDTVVVANATPKITLGTVVQELQAIRREIVFETAPNCAKLAKEQLVSGMGKIINAYLGFMTDESEAEIISNLNAGNLEIVNGSEQLWALVAGEPTPIPRSKLPSEFAVPTFAAASNELPMPTSAPIPTSAPTPTPLPFGSAFIVEGDFGRWEIYVKNVVLAQKISSSVSNSTEKASGRFAILFLSVINRGLSPDTFIAGANFRLRDAEGRTFEENIMASTYAQFQYNSDIGADINPDETNNVVAVFDISAQSAYYIIVPSMFSTLNANVLVQIP